MKDKQRKRPSAKAAEAVEASKMAPVGNKRMRFPTLKVRERPTLKGTVLVCGQGEVGQLGLGVNVERKFPTVVPTLKNIVEVKAGGMHTLVLDVKGNVYSFGCNDEGALGRFTEEDEENAAELVPDIVELPGKSVMVSAGDSHSACLLENGQVYAWGSFRNSHGSMGLTLEGNKRTPVPLLNDVTVVEIASGSEHLMMLTNVGKVYTVGCGEQGQLGRISMRSASGDGRRGNTDLLQPDLIRQAKPATRIWATRYGSYYEDVQGRVYAFGLNNYRQLVNAKRIKSPDLIVNPVLTELTKVKDLSGGQHHTIVLTETGGVYVIGRSDYGRLGLEGVREPITELKVISQLSTKKIVRVATGDCTSFALTANGEIFAWGMGFGYQLGTGNDDDQLTPTILSSKQMLKKKILSVSGGGQHTVFLVADEQSKEKDKPNAATNGVRGEMSKEVATKKS